MEKQFNRTNKTESTIEISNNRESAYSSKFYDLNFQVPRSQVQSLYENAAGPKIL
jgi:hypothetical protein